jgi:hypothetical protein
MCAPQRSTLSQLPDVPWRRSGAKANCRPVVQCTLNLWQVAIHSLTDQCLVLQTEFGRLEEASRHCDEDWPWFRFRFRIYSRFCVEVCDIIIFSV